MIRLAGSPGLSGTEVLLSKNCPPTHPPSVPYNLTNKLASCVNSIQGDDVRSKSSLIPDSDTPSQYTTQLCKSILRKQRMPLGIFLRFNQFETGNFLTNCVKLHKWQEQELVLLQLD